MNINWKLILFGANYTIILFVVQKVIELFKDRNRVRYEIQSKLYAEKRIESITDLYKSIYSLEIFVRDIIIQQPENFKGKIVYDYFSLYKKTIDSINSSHIFLEDDIYIKSIEYIKKVNAAIKPASKKAELWEHFFIDSGPLPENIKNQIELIRITKNQTKELKVIHSDVERLRNELRKEIMKKIYFR